MPFVKKDAAPKAKAPDTNVEALLTSLHASDAETRWQAARALGNFPSSVGELSLVLSDEKILRVREAIITTLMRIGTEQAVQALLPYLRSEDPALRNSAIDALQALPEVTQPFLGALLRDSDSDVRLLATELARNMPAAIANQFLSSVLLSETHPNVCAAAIDVLAEVGTREAVPALEACSKRFVEIPFLAFAAKTALARISAMES